LQDLGKVLPSDEHQRRQEREGDYLAADADVYGWVML
jgi:hypothetical protein